MEQLEILKQEKNPFMHREELVMKVRSENNPTKQEVLDLAKKNSELSVVTKIEGKFGTQEFEVEILTYESAEAKSQFETIPRKVKKKMEEDAKKAAEEAKKKAEEEAKAKEEAEKAAAEAPKEEASVEEQQKEEKTEETKPVEEEKKE